MKVGEKNLRDLIPLDEDSTAAGWHYLHKIPELFSGDSSPPIEFLDLGAGHGQSYDVARKVLGAERINWRGIDIDDSDEFLSRPENAPEVDTYDGVTLPYDNNQFDIVWSKQVLEHVRRPDATIAEVSRVLKPNGYFMGSVSQLEPYHSRSIFNWTYYGICTVFADHNLEVRELTPGVDGMLLMLRTLFGYDTGLNKLVNKTTPLNLFIEALFSPSTPDNRPSKTVSMQRLKVAGHIHFLSRKLATSKAPHIR